MAEQVDHGTDAWRVTLRSYVGDLKGVLRSTSALQALAAAIEPLPWVVIASPCDGTGRSLVIDDTSPDPPTRCGNCGGDLRPVCVDCGTRHGYGWPDLPEPTPEVCDFCGSGAEDAPYIQNCPHPHG